MRGRILLLAVLLIGAATSAEAEAWKTESWRSADKLFRSDPRWLGADAAFSVSLGGDRILWLFGDTFVGDGTMKRAKSAFIRNSIAVQRGRDLSFARVDFYWRGPASAPASYFPATSEAWLWPLHGIHRGGALTLFFMRVVPSTEGLGFKVDGSAAMRCDNPEEPPDRWTFRALALPKAPFDGAALFGVALLNRLDSVLAYCVAETPGHPAYLLRWRGVDFDRGDLSAPEWWEGSRFAPGHELSGPPAPVISAAATEFSVHRLLDGRYMQVQTVGFGGADVMGRFAPRPEGPWSERELLFRPRESGWHNTMVYAGKAHPELIGAPIVVSYATNHFDPGTLLKNKRLYYPRFIRVSPKSRP